MSLALIWLGIIAFVIIMYVILDGFTLGMGLLFPYIRENEDRDTLVGTVLPVWDGNETWLVLAGASLYGAFPEAFSTLFSALYLPLMLLIFGLLFRGISFEFRLKAQLSKHIWDKCLFSGSLMAVIAQGLVIGSFVQGFKVDPLTNEVLPYQWLSWFSVFCAASLVIGYTLLGSARLIKKTHGELQDRLYKVSSILQWLLLAAILFVGIYTPLISESAVNYWFNLEHSPFMVVFPVLILVLVGLHAFAIYHKLESLPFPILISIFLVAYIGLVLSDLPYLVPHKLTFMQAKADDGALLFMLFGVSILLPLLLFYTAYAYRVFGGKSNEKISY